MRKLCYSVILSVSFLGTSCAPQGENSSVPLRESSSFSLFDVMDYSPYRKGQGPGGAEPSLQEIREDLKIVQQMSREIRIYGMGPVADRILIAAKELGLGVHLGAWLNPDPQVALSENSPQEALYQSMTPANRMEIDFLLQALKNQANSRTPFVKSVIVGSETQLRGAMSDERLSNYLQYVRREVKRQGLTYPVTTAQIYADYHPTLVKHVDYILYHVHPFWEKVAIEDAADAVIRSWRDLREKLRSLERSGAQGFANKPIVIGETGWPTRGYPEGAAVPSEENQYRFLLDLQKQSQAYAQESGEDVRIMYFDAFDEDWKTGEGSVGNFWGLYDLQRQPKLAMRKLLGLAEPTPVQPPLPTDQPDIIPGSSPFHVAFGSGSVKFSVEKALWADLHFRINGGPQQNVRMNSLGSQLVFEVIGLKAKDKISYSFTYASPDVKDSPWSEVLVP